MLFLLSSCENNNACIDADDFGDVEKEIITVKPYSSQLCHLRASDRDNNYQGVSNALLKQCLVDAKCKDQTDGIELCEQGCVSACEDYKTEPRWVTNNPSGTFGNGVSIAPDRLIYITATGSVKLSEGYQNGDLQGCASGLRNYSYFGEYTNCNNEIVGGSNLNGSYLIQFDSNFITPGITNSTSLYNAQNKSLVLFQRFPVGYDASSKIPLNSDPDYTICIPKYPNDPKKISCSENIATDNYSFNPNLDHNASSKAFNFGTDMPRLISNGGFVKKNTDYESEEVIVLSDNNTEITSNPGSTEIILKENNYQDKFIELKINDTSCAGYLIQTLNIVKNNETHYRTGNISLSSEYTQRIIPYYENSKIKINISTSSSRLNSAGQPCYKNIQIKKSKYHDIIMPNSGFVQFKIKDIVDYSFGDLFGKLDIATPPALPLINDYVFCPPNEELSRIYKNNNILNNLKGLAIACGNSYTIQNLKNNSNLQFFGKSTTNLNNYQDSGTGFQEIEVIKDDNEIQKINFNQTISPKSQECISAGAGYCKKIDCSGGKISGIKAQFDNDSIKAVSVICKNNGGPITNEANSCTIFGRIINPNGDKTEIIDSYSSKTFLNSYSPNTAITFSSIPSGNVVNFVFGLNTYDLNKNSFFTSPSCSKNIQVSTCNIGAQSCSISINDNNFEAFKASYCNNGSGDDAVSDGEGGGGGGNSGGNSQNNGTTFTNPEFDNGYITSPERAKNDGYVEITDSAGVNLFSSEDTSNIHTANITLNSDKIIKYKIYGGSGGNNGCRYENAGNKGDAISGTLRFDNFTNLKLDIKVGSAGENGSPCFKTLTNSSESHNINKFEAFEFANYGIPVIYNSESPIYEENPYCQISNYMSNFISLLSNRNNTISLSSNFNQAQNGFNALNCSNGNGNSGASNNRGGGGGGNGNALQGRQLNINGTTQTYGGDSGDSYYNPLFHVKKPNISLSSISSSFIKINNNAITSNSYDIPAGTTSVSYELCGAKGGNGSTGYTGAYGSCLSGTLQNLPNSGLTINFIAGQPGTKGNPTSVVSTAGTYLVGGDGFNGGGSGGGASAIYANINGVNQFIAIAGGGGGANRYKSSINSLKFFSFSKVLIPGISEPQITLKYYRGDSAKDNINIRNQILNSTKSSYIFNAPFGYKFSKVIFASYGEPEIDGENYIINNDCHYKSSKEQIANLCIDKNSCEIKLSDFSSNLLSAQKCNDLSNLKLAIKLEFIKQDKTISTIRKLESSSTVTLVAPNNKVINDIVFASYGNPTKTIKNNIDFFEEGSCYSPDVVERIKLMCLGKNTCNFTLSDADLGSRIGSCAGINNQLAIVFISKNQTSLNIDKFLTNPTLIGGSGKGSGGAGGSASYISITRSDESHDSSRKDFLIIAGGGAGGSLTTNQQNVNNFERQNYVDNTALGLTLAVKYKSTQSSSTASDYYEYGDYISELNQNLDPIANLNVGSQNYTPEFFLRKGQILRILPKTFEKKWNSKEGPKECGVGMVLKITPRPALLCLDTTKTIEIANQSCIPNIIGSVSTPSIDSSGITINSPTSSDTNQLGCLNTVTCSTPNERTLTWNQYVSGTNASSMTTTYCPNPLCSAIVCTGGSDSTPQTCTQPNPLPTNCNIATPPSITETDTNKQVYYNSTTCANCRNLKLSSVLSPKITLNNPTECYDFENSDNLSVYNLLSSNLVNGDLTQDQIAKYKINHFNQQVRDDLFAYTNFVYSERNNGSTYSLKSPFNVDNQGMLSALVINNNNFKDLKLLTPTNPNQTFKFLSLKTNEYSNGQMLNVALCKESSDNSTDCQAIDISTASKKVILTDGNSATSTNYFNFNNLGELKKTKDFDTASTFLKCTNLTGTFARDPSFVCYLDDNGNSDEVKKYRLALKIPDIIDQDYSNNFGEYKVEVKVKKTESSSAVKIVKGILKPILENLDGVKDDPSTPINEEKPGILKTFYIYLIHNGVFQNILTLTAVLSISFFGLGYLIGINEIKHSEIIAIIIKIGFVYLFISPAFGWYWFEAFFVNFFKNSVDLLCFLVAETFDSSTAIKSSIITQDFSDKSILFDSVNEVVNLIFADAVQNKVLALLFSSIFGWIYFIIIFYAFLTYFYAIANSVLLYVTCQVITSILMVLGPIIFIFLFFKITKDIFDNWVKALIGFGLQQIFLVLTLTFFNSLIIIFLKLALGYKVCWSEVLSINLPVAKYSLFNFWTVAGTNSPSTFANVEAEESFGTSQNMPSLYLFLMLTIITNLMKQFIELFTNLAVTIAGGIKASTVGGDVAQLGKSIKDFAVDKVKKGYGATIGRGLDNLDNLVFSSGKIAKQQRIAKMKQFKLDMTTRAELTKVGNDAVSKYKKEKALELSQKTPAEQKSALEEVRKKAIKDYAEDKGIKNIDAIMDKRGLNYVGTNVFGATFQAIKQGAMSGGNLFNSINDKQASISFSKSEANAALKNMNKKDQDTFIESVEKGNIHVQKGKIENARSVAINVMKSPLTIAKAIGNPKETLKPGAKKIASGAYGAYNAVFGNNDLKKQAIKELEQAGKIAKYNDSSIVNKVLPNRIKNFARTDEDKRAIRNKMREIQDTKSIQTHNKITSKSVIRDLKATQEYSQNRSPKEAKNEIQDIKANLVRFGQRVKNTFTPNEKGVLSNQDKIANLIKENADKLKDKNKQDINSYKDKKDELGNTLKAINENLKDGNLKSFDEIKLIDGKNKIGAEYIELDNKIKNLESKNSDIEKMLKINEPGGLAEKSRKTYEEAKKVKQKYEQENGLLNKAVNRIGHITIGKLSKSSFQDRREYKEALNTVKAYEKIKDFEGFEKFNEKFVKDET